MAACRLRGFKSDLVKDLYIVQSVTKSSQTKNNNKNQKQTHTNKTKHSNPKQNSQTEAWQVPVHGLLNARVITLYHLDMVWQQKQKKNIKVTRPYQEVSEATKAQTTTKPCRNESGEKKGETDSETWANVRNDEGAPTAHRARSESAQ